MQSSPDSRVLILSLSGIGNFLMHMPALRAVKEAHPHWHVTVAVAPRGTKELAEHSPYIDQVLELSLKQSFPQHVRSIQILRKQAFSAGIMLSPGQLVKGAAYMAASGIPTRIGHQYPFIIQHNSLFLTHSIPEDAAAHDIEQNLALIKLLGISVPREARYELTLPIVNQKEASDILAQLAIPPGRPLVGFHPGSASKFEWKRWGIENFIALGKALIEQKQAHILLFGGPTEADLKEKIKDALSPHASVISHSSLLTTAALQKTCRFFVSNDSGLMHLAACAGVETFALFGPTDERKTGPRGLKSHVIRAAGTQPVYDTEKNNMLGTKNHATLQRLTVQTVLGQLATSGV